MQRKKEEVEEEEREDDLPTVAHDASDDCDGGADG